MTVGIKDSFKLIAISVVCMCAVFVCTCFVNLYLDLIPFDGKFDGQLKVLYDAQLASARISSAISGGFMGVIAVIMTLFYIKLYIDGHSKQLGILKAMGYSEGRLSLGFWVFGLSVLFGCAIGHVAAFIAMPYIYDIMTAGMGNVKICYHPTLTVYFVLLPTAVFAGISVLYAFVKLRRPVGEMMKGAVKSERVKVNEREEKERGFLVEMGLKTLGAKKLLAFFVAFAGFCFSAMIQMGVSMNNVAPDSMGLMILVIGLVVAAVSVIMAITSLINGNIKNVSLMKATGFSTKECVLSIFSGYIPIAVIGFAAGTVYQYGLLKLMVNVVFDNVASVATYNFDVGVFFITLAAFIVACAAVAFVCIFKLRKVSVKEIMLAE